MKGWMGSRGRGRRGGGGSAGRAPAQISNAPHCFLFEHIPAWLPLYFYLFPSSKPTNFLSSLSSSHYLSFTLCCSVISTWLHTNTLACMQKTEVRHLGSAQTQFSPSELGPNSFCSSIHPPSCPPPSLLIFCQP